MKCNLTIKRGFCAFIMAGLAAFVAPSVVQAVPYASTVSEAEGTVTFRLNESADNVKIVFSNPNSTLDMGALSKGTYTFPRGAAAAYEIQVTKSAPPIWTQISDDNPTFLQFFAPISISVNRNPASTNFGRIYVLDDGGQGSENGTRLTTEGIFVLNPDISDAFGQGDTGFTAGLEGFGVWAGTGGSDRYDPFQIEVGDDDYIYIGDANDPRAGLFRATPDLLSGELVLEGVGNNTAPAIHTVVYGLDTQGSLSAGTLKVWTTDGQWQGVTAANSVLRYDINSGPLPHNVAPTVIAQAGPPTSERDSDLSVAPDGNIFVTVAVDGGSGATGVPAVQVFSPTGTPLWSSVINGVDVFTNAYSLEVSPDNTKLAIIRRDRQTWIVGLTNGPDGQLPDLSTTNLVATFTVGNGNGRCVNWDLAGNLYVGNRSTERVRIFSPGGTTTAITRSSGTFEITVPANTVSIGNSVSSISESNATAVEFTVSRTGNTAAPLFVSFLLTGTASNGVDHSAFPEFITFPAGVTTTNISITLNNDSEAEFSETLVVVVNGGTNYSVGTASATTTILDDDTPELSVNLAQDESRLLEGFAGSKVGFEITRKGYLDIALTANIGYGGTASSGADFNGPTTVALDANAVTASFQITPVNDGAFEGNETVIVSAAAGVNYVPGAGTATATIIDDDPTPGTVLFADDFETNSAPRWVVNSNDEGADSAADFGFDYSQLYVPPAPGGSTTKGLRFRLNETTGAFNSVSASPLGLNLTGEYRLIFHMWNNYNGPLFNGGAGSTMHSTFGVGTTGDHANLGTSAASDGIWFIASGDGGSTLAVGDVSAYAGVNLLNDDSGVYAAGTGAPDSGIRRTTHPYYALWGNISAPAEQLNNFPGQTGTSGPGNLGLSWHTVVITRSNSVVTWVIDGILIASVPTEGIDLSTNVFVGFQDVFAGVSGVPAMSFALVDNLRVENMVPPVTGPIEISSIVINGGNVEITFTGSAGASAGSFTLQSSANVGSGYIDDNSATVQSLGGGTFKAITALDGTSRFYRIKQ